MKNCKSLYSFLVIIFVSGTIFSVSHPVLAEEDPAAHRALADVYARRKDLQALFRASDWKALASPKTKGLASLEDWARMYGYKEHQELALFGPHGSAINTAASNQASIEKSSTPPPPALAPIQDASQPIQKTPGTFNFSSVTAEKVLVVDPASHKILLSKEAATPHHLASITKLMTAILVREYDLPMDRIETVLASDEVGGARLRVTNGTPLTIKDIFYAMLVGSANNAAHALARLTGKPISEFVAAMNAKAKSIGLASTVFVDPSGIEVENMSTAQDIAALALTAFDEPIIHRAVTTAYYPLVAEGQTRQMKNTDGLLTDPNNGLYVMGGKTGYLEESKWNLVVKMKDYRERPLLIVTLGSASQADSFNDSARIAKWVWNHYQWK